MASKKEPEVFNLLNLYQDDDDDEDMEDADKSESDSQRREDELRVGANIDEEASTTIPKWSNVRPPMPVQAQGSVSDSDVLRRRREKPSIVDYGKDDVAMSPEPEDGEILGTSAGRVTYGEELVSNRDQQRTPSANVQTMKLNNQVDSPQLSSRVDILPLDQSVTLEVDAEVGEGVTLSSEDGIDSDHVQKFLLRPSPVKKCLDELQEKINKFLALKRLGKSFNVEVRNKKDYRNPDFLRHTVKYQDIDEIGSCFSKDVFDPHGYDRSDYFDAIEADMKREMERKEQERKKSLKVDFVSGGTHAGTGTTAQRVILPSPGVSNLSGGSQSGPADMLTREGRQNKKSKWDKVDGDKRNVLGGGQDTLSAAGAHAALFSANAGAGYAAFAQQRRREAEDKRSSDKKAERRT